MATLRIRGIDVAARFGWELGEISGWLSGPTYSRDAVPIPGRMAPAQNRWTAGESRRLGITFFSDHISLTERAAKIGTLDRLMQGIFPVETSDRPGIHTRCLVQSRQTVAIDGTDDVIMALGDIGVAYVLEAVDGVSLSNEATTLIALNNTPRELEVGSAAISPVTIHRGAWSAGQSRTIQYYGANGLLQRTITLTAPSGQSLAGTDDYLEVDHGNRTITKVTSSGVRSNAITWNPSRLFLTIDRVDTVDDTPPFVVCEGDVLFQYIKTWEL